MTSMGTNYKLCHLKIIKRNVCSLPPTSPPNDTPDADEHCFILTGTDCQYFIIIIAGNRYSENHYRPNTHNYTHFIAKMYRYIHQYKVKYRIRAINRQWICVVIAYYILTHFDEVGRKRAHTVIQQLGEGVEMNLCTCNQ